MKSTASKPETDWADEVAGTIIGPDYTATRGAISTALRAAEERGYARGYLAAANEIAEPYPPDIPMFAPLTNEEIETAVATMGGDISGRLHAQWARHWADVLRKRINAEEKQDG